MSHGAREIERFGSGPLSLWERVRVRAPRYLALHSLSRGTTSRALTPALSHPRCRERRQDASSSLFVALSIFCLCLTACGRAGEPELPIRAVISWPLPADGLKIPAPRTLIFDRAGKLIILDRAGRVLVMALGGECLRQWRMPEIALGNPEGLCELDDGRLIVGDTHYNRLVYFDSQGKVLKTVGTYGTGPGQFIWPVSIDQDRSGHIYVAEYGSNDRVQKFTTEGEFVLSFGKFGTEDGEFQRPSGVAWRDGKVYVADSTNHRIQVFSDDGKFIEVLGRTGTGAGAKQLDLYFPYDLRFGPDGDLYVIEYGASRLTRLDLRGRVIGRYGRSGGGERELQNPWGLAINSSGRIVLADTDNRRIVELER